MVSIIIPTYNSAVDIERCLHSARKQTHRRQEIIVVDNYSRDVTREIAKKYAEVYTHGLERSNQRNFGAAKAKGDFLLFIDSDMELMPEVIKECLNEALSRNIDAIVIPEVSVGEGFWARCKALERSCYLNDSLIEAPRFFKRETFLKFNGYDESLVGPEDWDLPLRMKKAGFSFSRVKTLIIHHEGRLTLWRTVRKKYLYGFTFSRYIKKHKKEAVRQILFRTSFLRNYKLLLRNPLLTLGFIVMKSCEFIAGASGMIVNKCLQHKEITS